MVDAITAMLEDKMIVKSPLKQLVASVSVGIFKGNTVLDLDYLEDSSAETDMNIVMTEAGRFIEIQGTGEDGDFTHNQLSEMIGLADSGIKTLIKKQRTILNLNKK